MPPKSEICRYFLRGSCQYGTRCKFLHPKQQQTQANPFGFGQQSGAPIQDKPQPFGFGSKSNQPKPFENKWSRFSPINKNNASAPRQPDNQSQAVDHECTNSESCKRVILDDLENEKPIWKLTCYSHRRSGPCDIVGDISYDELRALAYDDYKHGKSLQTIVERERNLLNSKLNEFQNLVNKPYTGSSDSTLSSQNLFAGGNTNVPIANNGFSTAVSSFSQLSGSLNTRSAAVPNYSFGQATSGSFGQATSGSFGQVSSFQNSNQPPSSVFQMNNSPFNSPGAFNSQPQQSIQSVFPFGTTRPSTGGISPQQNPFSTMANSSQTGNGVDKQNNFFTSAPSLASTTLGQSTNILSINNIPKENNNVDGSAWTKPEWKWNAGEIPEEAPPDVYIR